jgi:hypothetical protein
MYTALRNAVLNKHIMQMKKFQKMLKYSTDAVLSSLLLSDAIQPVTRHLLSVF